MLLAVTLVMAMIRIEGRAHARGCTDPNDCLSTNGHGLYFEEQGSLSEGSAQLDATSHAMITHFINNGSSVSFHARFFRPSSGTWMTGTGHVYAANFAGARYSVAQIYAYAPGTPWPTYLYWRLVDSTGASFWVGGSSLYNLALHLVAPNQTIYTLTFRPVNAALFPESGTAGTAVYHYDVLVHPGEAINGGVEYCMRADGSSDTAVFQAGIDVDPVIGAVSSAPTHVTMSCRNGALAQSFLWGYDYVSDAWHYGAALHMKRASYCGDGSYFTNAGTIIAIVDDEGIQMSGIVNDGNLEALWTPTGAACYVPSHMRHPELGFAGTCLGKPSIPVCSSTALFWAKVSGSTFLGDTRLP